MKKGLKKEIPCRFLSTRNGVGRKYGNYLKSDLVGKIRWDPNQKARIKHTKKTLKKGKRTKKFQKKVTDKQPAR